MAAKSTQVLTDAATLAAGTPTAASKAAALAAAGPIGSLESNAVLALRHFQEAYTLLTQMDAQYDGSDALKTTCESLLAVLV